MPGPFEAAGSSKDATKYAALGMGARQITGLWTQRNPYRDANVAYLFGKYYGASRFDSMLDGINREISALLSDDRRPGSSVYNSNSFPPALSYYSFKCIQNAQEIIRVIYEGNDGTLYDATAGQKTTLFSDSNGGRKRMIGVGTTLYFSDKLNQEKWMFPGGWQTSKNVQPGTLINVGAEPGTMQMALGGLTMKVIATEQVGSGTLIVYFNLADVPNKFANFAQAQITFNGLTTKTGLNGNTYAINGISTTLGTIDIAFAGSLTQYTADTGSGTTGTGITGSTAPTFSSTQFAIVADGGQQWKCYGSAVKNWGLAAETGVPTLAPLHGTRFWQPNTTLPTGFFYAILDNNQNVQVYVKNTAGINAGTTGKTYPNFTVSEPYPNLSTNNATFTTVDGGVIWWNCGPIGSWQASTKPTNYSVVLDSNQNLQLAIVAGTTGGTEPTWATTIGASTTDGGTTWICLGPGVAISTASWKWSFSLHSIDGSVSTASPTSVIQGGILGPPTGTTHLVQIIFTYLSINGTFKIDNQTDQIWIWRTAMGQSTLILEDQIPIDYVYSTGQFNYQEQGILDTSTNGGGALNALIAAPVSDANDPPPDALTGFSYHLQRIWGFVDNVLYYSGGPDTTTGNGNTAWPPLNQVVYQAGIIKVVPITIENGGLLVFTTLGIQLLLGTGTSSNPFYTTQYCDKVNLANYDSLDVLGTLIYLMESNGKVSSLAVEYPFNPQSGYSEIGFPVGDQFLKVTTGGISSALYNPATSYLSWNIGNSGDTGMYVADGAVGWFRMSSAAPPESGIIWHPRAAIAGGTSAVMSIETAPGVFTLLIGPNTTGPILQRDQTGTVFSDNGTPYPAWDAKGATLLCSTGEEAELAWIATKSLAVGARPVLGLLMNEIKAVPATLPWNLLQPIISDPANLPPSKTAYSDRYGCDQNGFTPRGDCCLIKFDYGSQAFGDKLFDFQIYGAKEDERKAGQ